ncbi:hypothetical protein TNCV_321031 [Trichonephila clavipes]|nr:hypothetical protein TNCV_321031 [Trichonephila clavipes]
MCTGKKEKSLKEDQGGRRNSDNDKRKRGVGSTESSIQINRRTKKFKQEVMGCKRSIPTSRSGRPQRKHSKGPERQVDKRRVSSSVNSYTPSRKRFRQGETTLQERDIGPYTLRHRVKKAAESKSSRGEMHGQRGLVRSRGRRFHEPRPYDKDPSYRQQSRRQSCQEQERTDKMSESTTRQRSQTARAPGYGRKINEQKDCVPRNPSWRRQRQQKILASIREKFEEEVPVVLTRRSNSTSEVVGEL